MSDQERFDAARIPSNVLRNDYDALYHTARELLARRGELGDFILVLGPPESPRLFDKVMHALEDINKPR